jgi:serine/threonine-protein kinase
MKGRSFLAELKRRNVLRAGAFYAATAWLLVQVATQVFPYYDIPAWAVRWLIAALVIGFPFAMLFAWFYEFTAQGFKRESEVEPSQSLARQTGRTLDRWIIAVLALAVVLLLTDKFVLRQDAETIVGKSIAVLPLVNESGNPEDQYFSDGLSEDLISALTQIRGLKVIGRNSSFQFRDQVADTHTIGRKLDVATLLEGSVRRQGDKLHIVATLVNARDGRTLWSQTYDRQFRDIFAVQREIAQAVAAALQVTLLGDRLQSKAQPSNLNLEAYQALLQGNFYMERNTRDANLKAISYYETAIDLDPDYALAHAQIAEARAIHGAQFPQTPEQIDADWAKARASANTALALDPTLAAAHATLGWILALDFDWHGAETHYRRALELSPDAAIPKRRLADLLASQGHPEDAIDLLRQAIVLDPLDMDNHFWLATYLVALDGHGIQAEQAIRKAIELQPAASGNYGTLTVIEIQRGNAAAALRAAQKEAEGFWQDYALALAKQVGDDRVAADASLDALIDDYALLGPFQIATVYALRKEPDQAFAWLDRAWETRDPGIGSLLYDPFLLAYEDDPRFAAFCRKVGLPVPKAAIDAEMPATSEIAPTR